ncbi:hypothetical protein [Paraburkholderia elongata]|uniref:Uncharacterized protein n=1 Tax=Paraburkholderia elongata TaxID=2675747 RepID=A0A972SQE0_9BURK|nr:hypothetical protein [Paraburkholderia elongata]NPT62020.1 hypothetical protein [Paraburkholderia elongata]
MRRTYGYRDFTIELEVESVGGIARGNGLSVPEGYIGVFHIFLGARPATIQPLRFGRDNGCPVPTEVETLMRGHVVAQRIVGGTITASTARPAR